MLLEQVYTGLYIGKYIHVDDYIHGIKKNITPRYLTCGGSSFTASHIGHRDTVDDLNRLTLSVLSRSDMCSGLVRNSLHPSVTSLGESASSRSSLCCRYVQIGSA